MQASNTLRLLFAAAVVAASVANAQVPVPNAPGAVPNQAGAAQLGTQNSVPAKVSDDLQRGTLGRIETLMRAQVEEDMRAKAMGLSTGSASGLPSMPAAGGIPLPGFGKGTSGIPSINGGAPATPTTSDEGSGLAGYLTSSVVLFRGTVTAEVMHEGDLFTIHLGDKLMDWNVVRIDMDGVHVQKRIERFKPRSTQVLDKTLPGLRSAAGSMITATVDQPPSKKSVPVTPAKPKAPADSTAIQPAIPRNVAEAEAKKQGEDPEQKYDGKGNGVVCAENMPCTQQ